MTEKVGNYLNCAHQIKLDAMKMGVATPRMCKHPQRNYESCCPSTCPIDVKHQKPVGLSEWFSKLSLEVKEDENRI